MAYPVADILSARGVPFVFVTGYEADTVDDRFSHVPSSAKTNRATSVAAALRARPKCHSGWRPGIGHDSGAFALRLLTGLATAFYSVRFVHRLHDDVCNPKQGLVSGRARS